MYYLNLPVRCIMDRCQLSILSQQSADFYRHLKWWGVCFAGVRRTLEKHLATEELAKVTMCSSVVSDCFFFFVPHTQTLQWSRNLILNARRSDGLVLQIPFTGCHLFYIFDTTHLMSSYIASTTPEDPHLANCALCHVLIHCVCCDCFPSTNYFTAQSAKIACHSRAFRWSS